MTQQSPTGAAPCPVCDAPRSPESERATVRSNVRRFRQERFEVWRCGSCGSIHAAEEVDLAHYYAGYPVFNAQLDWMFRVVYGSLLQRLTAAGLTPEMRVLDYGCGNGLLVEFLRTQGYAEVHGYDRFSPGFDDPAVLEGPYDCIVSQDVIEHVDSPRALLESFDGMLRPGGVCVIGTPDAAAIDLSAAEDYVHVLHLPYHRHILSMDALSGCGEALGWEVTARYDTMYNNTLVPTMNPRFILHYVRAHDDVFDLVAEPVKLSPRLLSPVTLYFALFGYFHDRHTDITVAFRKPD